MPDPEPIRAVAENFVRHDRRADGADEGERSQRRDRDRNRDEGEQHGGADGTSPEDAAGCSVKKRDVPEQVQRGAAAERHGRHGLELVADVVERRLQAEGEEDDAGDQRQVQVAVGVQREPVQLEAVLVTRRPEDQPRQAASSGCRTSIRCSR